MSLFQQQYSGGAAFGRQPLVTFKAGKMTAENIAGSKLKVTADKRKGQISVVQGDDQMMHFQWKDRTTGVIDDDIIIFPEDAEFKKVNTARDGDRVYILQYKNSSRRFFFWMQDKASDKDTENAKKVQDYLSNTVAPPPSNPALGGDQAALMQMLGAISRQGGQGAGASGVQVSDLQSILQNLGMPAGQAQPQTGRTAQPARPAAQPQTAPAPAQSQPPAQGTTAPSQPPSGGQAEDEYDEEAMLRLALEESLRDAHPPNEQGGTGSGGPRNNPSNNNSRQPGGDNMDTDT